MRGGRRTESPYSSGRPKQQACASPPAAQTLTPSLSRRRQHFEGAPGLLEARTCVPGYPRHAALRCLAVGARQLSAVIIPPQLLFYFLAVFAARPRLAVPASLPRHSRPLGLQHAETAGRAASDPGRDSSRTSATGAPRPDLA
jgi:hypothetical protein